MHRAVSWVLRRLPALATTASTLVAGLALILVSARLNDDHPWAAGVFVNVGSTTLLFAPLVGLTTLFGRQIVRSQRRRDARIDAIASDVDAVRRDVGTALQELSERAVGRLAEGRADEEATIAAVATDPTSTGVADALRVGTRLHFSSARGPRVRVSNTDVYARWQPGRERSAVIVTVERRNGRRYRQLRWSEGVPADELAYEVGLVLKDIGRYPGDIAYDPGRMFGELHHLLELGYRAQTGAGSVVDPIGPIVQLAGEKWAITDVSLTITEMFHPYEITLDRLDRLDWDAHLRGRHDIDIGGFREAFDTAVELMAEGNLTAPPPLDGPFDEA